MLKFICYFNLIYGGVLLWTYVITDPLYFDYYLIAGLILTLWYNWETLKQLKGLRNRLNKLNRLIGMVTILFGLLLLFSSLGMIKRGATNQITELLILGPVYITFGITAIYLTAKTLKLYKA